MTATFAIVRVTARNVLGLRRLIGFGLLAVFPGGVFYLVSRQATDAGQVENFTGMALFVFFAVVVPIVTIVVSASVLGAERRGETLSFLVMRPLNRYSIATAKLLSAIAASFAITGAGALVLGTLGSLALASFGYLPALLAATLIATAGYSAIYVPLGYITERATIIGFTYIFVWELGVAGGVAGLTGSSPWRIAASALVDLVPGPLDATVVNDAIGALQPGAGGASIKILVLCAISIGLTGWLLRTRDLA